MIQLLRLDPDTLINPQSIVEITVSNLNELRKERGQYYQTQEQRAQLDNKFWEVAIYLRSDGGGYNPQRYTSRFATQKEAQNWVTSKFKTVIVSQL